MARIAATISFTAASAFYYFAPPLSVSSKSVFGNNDNNNNLTSATTINSNQLDLDSENICCWKDFSLVHDARNWIRSWCAKNDNSNSNDSNKDNSDNRFVKEVDTFCGNDGNIKFFETTTTKSSQQPPETQVQVWRLGKDSSPDFPPLTKDEMMTQHQFPLFYSTGKLSSPEEIFKLSAAPVLRLIVFVPNSTTRRVLSEVTNPTRRMKWDANCRQYTILQSCRREKEEDNNNKNNSSSSGGDDEQQVWLNQSISEENNVNNKNTSTETTNSHISNNNSNTSDGSEPLQDVSFIPEINTHLLKNDSYQQMLTNRMRPGFLFESVRWTYHQVYSTMTSAFGVKPRCSYFERVYGEKKVKHCSSSSSSSDSSSNSRVLTIRTAIDTSLPFPLPSSSSSSSSKQQQEQKREQEQEPSEKSSSLTSSLYSYYSKIKSNDEKQIHEIKNKLVDFTNNNNNNINNKENNSNHKHENQVQLVHSLALLLAHQCNFPREDNVPNHSHFQEYLMLPIPKGSCSKKVTELAETLGCEDMSMMNNNNNNNNKKGEEDKLLNFYEKEFLPNCCCVNENGNNQQQQQTLSCLPEDGVLFSFTTVNAAGLVGYPRWFENYVHKTFSNMTTTSLIAQVQQNDDKK